VLASQPASIIRFHRAFSPFDDAVRRGRPSLVATVVTVPTQTAWSAGCYLFS
jgi:hypothetical protein